MKISQANRILAKLPWKLA